MSWPKRTLTFGLTSLAIQWFFVAKAWLTVLETKELADGVVVVAAKKSVNWPYLIPGLGALLLLDGESFEITISAYSQRASFYVDLVEDFPTDELIASRENDVIYVKDRRDGELYAAFVVRE